jgi:hypothetical protein
MTALWCGHDDAVLAQIHSVSAVAGGCLEVVPCLATRTIRPYVVGYSGFRATPEGAQLRPLNVTTLIIDWTGVPPLVTGPRDTGLRYEGAGWREGISIGVTPIGVRALFGVRQSELVGRIAPLDELLGSRAVRLAGRLAELPDWPARFTALRRLGQPDDIANVVAFLAGPDGAWITGQNIRATGGFIV